VNGIWDMKEADVPIPFAGKSYIFSLRGGYPSRLRVVRRANPNPDEHLDLMGVAGAPRDRLKR
jgi:hypothetical protein